MNIETLRPQGLPFTLMTTTKDLLVVADGEGNELFTYCPQLGVMPGLGDFDDNPLLYLPKCLQLIIGPVSDLTQMKRQWAEAARTNNRYGTFPREAWPNDAPLPFIAALEEPVYAAEHDDILANCERSFGALADLIAEEKTIH